MISRSGTTRHRTLESFGYEWTTFSDIQPEDEQFWQVYVEDVPFEEFAGARALDAGCGKGRYSVFTARKVGRLVAVDGSRATEAAARNLRGVPADVVRADIADLPFQPGTFDFVQCLGVLHHLDDPAGGFRSISATLRSGGVMLLYLYSRDPSLTVRTVGLFSARLLRRATTRIPHRVLRWISLPVAALLYGLLVLPGTRFQSLPLATYRRKPLRSLWLDTFDRLSAPIENRYTWEDVETWFTEYETIAVRENAGLFITLRKR